MKRVRFFMCLCGEAYAGSGIGCQYLFWIDGVRTAHSADDAVNDVIDYAKFSSRWYQAVIRVYSAAGNVIETHEHSSLSRPIRKVEIAKVTMVLRLA